MCLLYRAVVAPAEHARACVAVAHGGVGLYHRQGAVSSVPRIAAQGCIVTAAFKAFKPSLALKLPSCSM